MQHSGVQRVLDAPGANEVFGCPPSTKKFPTNSSKKFLMTFLVISQNFIYISMSFAQITSQKFPLSFLKIFPDAPLILDARGRHLFSLHFYAFTLIFRHLPQGLIGRYIKSHLYL